MADLWDPLEAAKEHSADLVLASRKREMQNILKSYVGFYDPFCELLQNAMDAVDARERELAEDGYRKSLSIVIDLQQNLVRVSDNGIGFTMGSTTSNSGRSPRIGRSWLKSKMVGVGLTTTRES